MPKYWYGHDESADRVHFPLQANNRQFTSLQTQSIRMQIRSTNMQITRDQSIPQNGRWDRYCLVTIFNHLHASTLACALLPNWGSCAAWLPNQQGGFYVDVSGRKLMHTQYLLRRQSCAQMVRTIVACQIRQANQ